MAVHGDPRQEKHFDLKHQNGTNKEIFFLLKSVQFNALYTCFTVNTAVYALVPRIESTDKLFPM